MWKQRDFINISRENILASFFFIVRNKKYIAIVRMCTHYSISVLCCYCCYSLASYRNAFRHWFRLLLASTFKCYNFTVCNSEWTYTLSIFSSKNKNFRLEQFRVIFVTRVYLRMIGFFDKSRDQFFD